mgnify:CR=1 FL=1
MLLEIDRQGEVVSADFVEGVIRSVQRMTYTNVNLILEGDAGLVRFLMRDRHGTPFEHNAFRFHVRCPIFVAREWFRHRIGSFNEFSMRYAKATEDFYVPDAEDVRTQVGKPGAYSFEPVDAARSRVTDSMAIMEKLKSTYAGQAGVPLDELDGLTVSGDDWWFNVRASNTEPLLRLNVEARDAESVKRISDAALAIIRG